MCDDFSLTLLIWAGDFWPWEEIKPTKNEDYESAENR